MSTDIAESQARSERSKIIPTQDHLVNALSNLEIASAAGSQGPRRLSDVALTTSAVQPLALWQPLAAEEARSLLEAQSPPTPRLGLRPPVSVSSSAPERQLSTVEKGTMVERHHGGAARRRVTEDGELVLVPARPPKPKIAGMWGAHRRRLLATDSNAKAKTPPPARHASESSASRPVSESSEVLHKTRRKPVRSWLARPRPAFRQDHNLEHTVLLRPNEFTTTTAQYRTYGCQWVLTRRGDDGGSLTDMKKDLHTEYERWVEKKKALDHLRQGVERERAEIAQREEFLSHEPHKRAR